MKTLLKFLVFLVLVVAAVEFTTKGERGAFGGLFVKLGIVKHGDDRTLKERVESNLEQARENEQRRLQTVEENSNTEP